MLWLRVAGRSPCSLCNCHMAPSRAAVHTHPSKRYPPVPPIPSTPPICLQGKVDMSVAIVPMSAEMGWSASVSGLVQVCGCGCVDMSAAGQEQGVIRGGFVVGVAA